MDTIAHPRFGRVHSAKLQSNSTAAGSANPATGVRSNRRRHDRSHHSPRPKGKGLVSTIYLSPRRIQLAVERGAVNGHNKLGSASRHDKPRVGRQVSMLDQLNLLWQRPSGDKLFHGADANKRRALLEIARLQTVVINELCDRLVQLECACEMMAKAADSYRSRLDTFKLPPKRRRVLELIARGIPMKEIASTMNISIKTVEYHWSLIKVQLNIQTYQEATIIAMKSGMVV